MTRDVLPILIVFRVKLLRRFRRFSNHCDCSEVIPFCKPMSKREFDALGAELQQALHHQPYMQRMRRSIKAEISITDAKGEMHVLYDNHWSEEQSAEYIMRARGKVSPQAPGSAAQIGGYIQQSPSVPAGPMGYMQQSQHRGGDRHMYSSGVEPRAMVNRMPVRSLQAGTRASYHSPRERWTYGEDNLCSDREENEQISWRANAASTFSHGRHAQLQSAWAEQDLQVLPMPECPPVNHNEDSLREDRQSFRDRL